MLTQKKTGNKQTYDAFAEKPILTTAFAPDALIYTYAGGQRVEGIKVLRYDLICRDTKTKVHRKLRKIDVLFAIKADTLSTVKEGITFDKDVKARNLRTPEKRADRPNVLTTEKLNLGLNREVRIGMRSGHVLRGWMLRYSRYNIVLNINGALVLVYRHGVLEYAVTPKT